MKFGKIIWILLVSLLLTNCAQRTHTGAIMGATTTTAVCVEQLNVSAYMAAGCAVVGAWAGAEIMYNSDKDIHNAVFVDHLNKKKDLHQLAKENPNKTYKELEKMRDEQ